MKNISLLEMTTLPVSEENVVSSVLQKTDEKVIAESKSSNFGDFTWAHNGTAYYKMESMIATLYRAVNDAGAYKSYLTFSAFGSSIIGWTQKLDPESNAGIFYYIELLNAANGVLLKWDLPQIVIFCQHKGSPIFFQKDNVNPDIYDIVTQCRLIQLKPHSGIRC